jgi:hypothetical protein
MTPYQRIVRAARLGVGMSLSAEDVAKLAMDNAIVTVANGDDNRDRLPDDELAHGACFTDKHSKLPVIFPRPCDGDGWYRCKECAHWTGKVTP